MATRKVKCLMTSVLAFLCFLFSTSKSQDYDHCGLRSASTRSRIIGGIQSRHGMWPWQVAIYKGSDDGMKQKQFICGGALINMKWVITTAHCFYKISETSSRIRYVEDSSTPNKYHVVAGDYNIFRKENTEQVRQALNIRIFPGYRHAPYYVNDIALIELNETVTLGPFVRTICIPDSNEKVSVPGKVASIAGWGRTTKSIRSPVLLHSAYQIQNDDLCDQATAYFFNRSVTFCAGSGKGGNDTCQGDSGSSLVRQVFHKGAQRWVTVGLVSWGEGCGLKGKYGYYTRMEPFVPWIQKTIKVNCGKPSNIRNGRYTGKDFSEGSRVKYKCKRGYKLKGRPRRKCRPNWEWSKAPVCRKAQCPRLSSPRNGSRRPAKRTYFYRDRVRFSCKTNFTRIGKPFIICKHDATWSGSQAFCLAPCPDPGIPKGGSRLDHSFRHNNLVRFSCNRGRKMEGARTIRCNRGRWNQSPPKCLGQAAMCARPRTPANGNIGTRKSLYNNKDRLRFFCKLGYKLDGDEYAVCVNGKWNKDPPTCERICSYPGRIANGYFSGSEFIEGREVRFYCHGGFDLIGSQTIRCLPTGRWTSGQRPECKRRCNNPVIPSNGPKSKPSLVRGYQTKHGTAIKFGCRPRYTLEGRQTIRCDDGRWSGNIPSCKGGCEIPNNFTGVHSSPRVLPGQNVPHSSRIRFSCLNNKTLNGSKESVCDDRNWSALFPKCEVFETDCQDPGVPQNGYVTSLPRVDFPQGTTIIFACNNTYTPQGHQIIECQSGKWSHNIPKCLAPCEDPGVPQDGIRYDSAFQHDDRVRFACKSGKIMKGEAVIRCNDGKWNHEPPKCRGAIKTLCHTFFIWSDIFCEIK